MNVEETLSVAQEHHRAGEFAQAEALYRQILAEDAESVPAMRGFAALASQMNRSDIAANVLTQALVISPKVAELHLQFAQACETLKRFDEAATGYERALQLQPKNHEAVNSFGVFLGKKGELEKAEATFRRAIRLAPEFAAARQNLGLALEQQGKIAEAIEVYQESVRDIPKSPDAINSLGILLVRQNRFDEAMEYFRQAVAAHPNNHLSQYNLGRALQRLQNYFEAIPHLRRATELFVSPDYYCSLGMALADEGQVREARVAFDEAIRLDPEHADARGNRALTLLLLGEYGEGWREYEWRWKHREYPHNRRYTHVPMWRGAHRPGQTILVHSEQGLGDSVMFSRYAPLLAERGLRVIVQVQDELVSLLQSLPGGVEVIGNEKTPPHFDWQVPMLSLAMSFGTRVESIPANIPYLSATEKKIEALKSALQAEPGKRKIGLVWGGRASHPRDKSRSIPLAKFAALAQAKDCAFFGLQKGPAAAQAANAIEGFSITGLGGQLNSFADTAAVIAQLDLVISVDTAVVHVAGAMGKPCWVLLSSAPDFRWMIEREDSPWYPSVRLFRQQSAGDWESVIERVARELQKPR